MKQQRYGRAIRLASTVGLSREEWLTIRQQGIGSSDAAVAVGLSPYKSALSAYSHAWRSLNNIHADHVITSMPITQ